MDGAAYHMEQLQVQHDIENALNKALDLGMTKDEVKLLAWATGVSLDDKEKSNGTLRAR